VIQNFRLCDKIIGIKLSQKYNARVCKIKFNKQLNNKKEQWHKALLFNLKPNLQINLVCVIIENVWKVFSINNRKIKKATNYELNTNLVTTLYYFKFSNQTISILIYIKILKEA
jgi:hypothetical protein